MIELRVRRRQGDFLLDVDLQCGGRVVGLFGPSGSGKTTLLNCIAGIATAESTKIKIGDNVLGDSSAAVDTPVRRRRVGYVFQDGLLFEHMNVRANILYGRHHAKAADALDEIVEMLELGELLDRSPAQISGGEKRRVAIARALLSGPAVLLFDEPLSGLDAPRAGRVLGYISRVLERFAIPAIYVSHAISDVIFLCDEVIALREGKIIAQGPPRNILVAEAGGLGQAAGQAGELCNTFRVRSGERDAESSAMRCDIGGLSILGYAFGNMNRRTPLTCTVRASDIILSARRPEGLSARNILSGVIREIGELDERSVITIEAGPLWLVEISRATRKEMGLIRGQTIHLIVKATAVGFH